MDWPVALVASVTLLTVGAVLATLLWQVMEIGKERARDDAHGLREERS